MSATRTMLIKNKQYLLINEKAPSRKDADSLLGEIYPFNKVQQSSKPSKQSKNRKSKEAHHHEEPALQSTLL